MYTCYNTLFHIHRCNVFLVEYIVLLKGFITIFFLARHWFKGSDTTVFIKFCENKYSRLLADDECDDGFLESVWGALHNADRFLHLLYNRGLWLSKEDALQASDYGLQFCRHYTKAATISFGRHLPRFKYIPKFHMHSHVTDTLAEHARQFGYALNPLVNSCQQDEDFVGRIAAIARAQHSRTLNRRVLSKYKLALSTKW